LFIENIICGLRNGVQEGLQN